jgi:hypothetical protein
LQKFYDALLAKGMKPPLARKIAAITLLVWKKRVRFEAGQNVLQSYIFTESVPETLMDGAHKVRRDITHMDRVERGAARLRSKVPFTARVHGIQRSSQWQRRQAKKKERTLEPPADMPTSQDFTEMAEAARPGGYPWIRYNE